MAISESDYPHTRQVVRETMSFTKAAAILGCSVNALYHLYRKEGWPIPSNPSMLKIDLCLVAEMRGEGKTYKEIGEELGVKPAQICQLMSDQDMVCKRAPIPTQKAKQYYQRMKEGKTYEEIGKEFGVTRQNVDLVLRYWYGQNIGKRYGKKGKGLDIAAMAQLKKQGWSNIQIADLFEIHPGYVYSLLKNVWGEHIGLGKRYSWDVYAGWALFEEGWTYKQIAEKYGKHMMTIANGIQRIRRRY